jgi:hypothetical protein
MTLTKPGSRTARGGRTLLLLLAVGSVLFGVSLMRSALPAAADDAVSITPAGGGSALGFNFLLPTTAKCSTPTNVANGDILYSYVVDNTKISASQLGTMTFPPGNAFPTLGQYVGAYLESGGGVPYDQIATLPQSGQISAPAGFSWEPYVNLQDFGANAASGDDLYPGTFNIGIACVTHTGAIDSNEFWNIQITFTASSSDTGGFTWALAPFATVTSLTSSPSGSVASGGTATLTATVTPATASGTVQFYDGSTAIGAAQPVTVASGVASATYVDGSLTDGTHTLKAVFTPTDYSGTTSGGTNVYGASTSQTVTLKVGSSGATTTTTTTPGGTTTTTTPGETTTTTTTSSSSTSSTTTASGGGGGGDPSTGGSGSTSTSSQLAATGSPILEELAFAAAAAFVGLFLLSFAVPTRRRGQYAVGRW